MTPSAVDQLADPFGPSRTRSSSPLCISMDFVCAACAAVACNARQIDPNIQKFASCHMWASSPLSAFSRSAAALIASRKSKQLQGKGRPSAVACARKGSFRSDLPLNPSHAATTCQSPKLNLSAAWLSDSAVAPAAAAAMLLAAARVDCGCGTLLAAGNSSNALNGISCCGHDRSAAQAGGRHTLTTSLLTTQHQAWLVTKQHCLTGCFGAHQRSLHQTRLTCYQACTCQLQHTRPQDLVARCCRGWTQVGLQDSHRHAHTQTQCCSTQQRNRSNHISAGMQALPVPLLPQHPGTQPHAASILSCCTLGTPP